MSITPHSSGRSLEQSCIAFLLSVAAAVNCLLPAPVQLLLARAACCVCVCSLSRIKPCLTCLLSVASSPALCLPPSNCCWLVLLPAVCVFLQSVQKKSGQPSFKTLDSTIQTLNKDTGKREAITYR
jgi:hypothetical protein